MFPDAIVLAPATGSAIEFANAGETHSDPAADQTLRFTGTIDSSTDSAAIDTSAIGYFGKDYNSTSVDTGHRGGNGGAGGSISVRLSEPHNGVSATSLTTKSSDGIDVLSEGGKGGKGENSSLDPGWGRRRWRQQRPAGAEQQRHSHAKDERNRHFATDPRWTGR